MPTRSARPVAHAAGRCIRRRDREPRQELPRALTPPLGVDCGHPHASWCRCARASGRSSIPDTPVITSPSSLGTVRGPLRPRYRPPAAQRHGSPSLVDTFQLEAGKRAHGGDVLVARPVASASSSRGSVRRSDEVARLLDRPSRASRMAAGTRSPRSAYRGPPPRQADAGGRPARCPGSPHALRSQSPPR